MLQPALANRRGYARCGPAPFGLRRAPGGFVPDEVEAEAIASLARLYANGRLLREIAQEMNDLGFTTRRGRPWSIASVAYTLDRLDRRGVAVSSRS